MQKKIVFLGVLVGVLIVAFLMFQKPSDIVIKENKSVHLSSGKLMCVENFPSKYVAPRNVDVWLPENYSKNKKYAVLYMHDGQMLFDSTTTWNKQEWKVDEIASRLMQEGKTRNFIVVAVHNISNIRWNDYFPQKAYNYVPKADQEDIAKQAAENKFDMTMNADNYLLFLTKELKPYIDSKFSVETNRASTFIAGSSMGGLISMYAVCEYPDVFGSAACLSTHWPGIMVYDNNPVPDAIFNYMKEHVPSPKTHRFYFDFGTKTLDQYYPQYQDAINTIFMDKGYDNSNFKNLKFEGADHSENSWNKRLDIALVFLLKK